MKLFIASIILLVVLQKCEKVLTNSNNLDDATVLPDEPKNCLICLEEVKVIDCKHPCCSGTFHQKCLNDWLSYGVISCPNCKGNPLEGIRICFKCRLTKNDDELVNKKCCDKDLCKNCFNKMKTECFCGKDLIEVTIFEPIRLCTKCESQQGIYTYSSRCPQIFCEKCFKVLYRESKGYCPYCGEKKLKKSFSCFS
ncbi:uncharacterized protein LOC126897411 [Daktulosphaira vitifoliae]|uniref:uncharacterized protein LOC126897411 n=1 Tax=Daktulosphaira vitifoliae TaxID=58002 RepID=UPI0021AA15D3|nr:uncharacterized protein LOC126897411 [Daktulosphaira vitifoliae]